jgi:hypothetical protein
MATPPAPPPSPSQASNLSARGAWLFGAAAILTGSAVLGASIWADDARMEAPRWVAAAAGAVFVLAGLAVVKGYVWDRGVERPDDVWSQLFGTLICSGFAGIAGWVAFGPGERRFRVSGPIPLQWLPPAVNDWLGRGAFGLVAGLAGLLALLFWGRLLWRLRLRPWRDWLRFAGALVLTGGAALAVLQATGDVRLWPANRGLRQALASPGRSDAERLQLVLAAKLANPAYVRWQHREWFQQAYQAFDEEVLLKELRSQITARVTPPAGVEAITIPIVSSRLPVVDGRLGPDEWSRATRIDLEKGTTLYALSDGRRLYVAADVPSDTTEEGFDQLRFYYHVDLAGVIAHERVHVSRSARDAFASYRLSHMVRSADARAMPLSEGHIYRLGSGASSMIGHRQFELVLDLDETGLHPGVLFAAYAEVETDPITDWGGRFRERAYAGRLGSQAAPVWLVIGSRPEKP